jgi:hypothetical protein
LCGAWARASVGFVVVVFVFFVLGLMLITRCRLACLALCLSSILGLGSHGSHGSHGSLVEKVGVNRGRACEMRLVDEDAVELGRVDLVRRVVHAHDDASGVDFCDVILV